MQTRPRELILLTWVLSVVTIQVTKRTAESSLGQRWCADSSWSLNQGRSLQGKQISRVKLGVRSDANSNVSLCKTVGNA